MARPDAKDQLSRYNDAKAIKARNENDYRMAAAYCLPRHYGAWSTEGPASYGLSAASAKRVAYDTTGARSLPKYMAVLERISTPHNMKWHGITAEQTELMKIHRVREYFQDLTNLLFTQRYNGYSNFIQTQSEVYCGMGVYGMGPKYLGQRTPNSLYQKPAFLYRACAFRDIFVLVNDEGEIDTVFRRFYLNYRQFLQKFKDAPVPKCFAASAAPGAPRKDSEFMEFVHIVHPRDDFDPEAIDNRRHPIVGSYISVKDAEYVGEEQGFRSLPYLTPRTFTEAGDPYAISPAIQALSAMGTASAMKKTMIKQGQKAVDPVLLAYDDGMINGSVDLRPGKVNYGGVDSQGRLMIRALETGNFNVGKDMITDERTDIEDTFFVKIFQALLETPEMNIPQVMDRISKESTLLSPTMGRIQSEDLTRNIGREIDIAIEMGLIATSKNAPGLQMPPELIEAGGGYKITFTSPMAKGMYAEEVSGFMRAVQNAAEVVNLTGDQSHMDHFNFNTAIPEMADYMAVPARWLNDNPTKKAIAEQRSQQQTQEQMMKNAAPLASALKTMSPEQGASAQPTAV